MHLRERFVSLGPGADSPDLRASLGALAGLVIGDLGLADALTDVASFAVRAVPGADGAGVTLLHVDQVERVQARAASAPFVAAIEDIEHQVVHEGPCITATLQRRTVRSGLLGGDPQWPRFGPRVGRLGVQSLLCLPLLLADHAVGAITAYAHEKDAFDDHAAELGELFAARAAVAVHNAQVLARARALTGQLQTAISSRPVIDQAIGLLRARSGRTADEAFSILRDISQRNNVKLASIAARIVDEAVGRARAHSREL